jgi:hypothetical protein
MISLTNYFGLQVVILKFGILFNAILLKGFEGYHLYLVHPLAEILHGFIKGIGSHCQHPEISNYESFW